ncbi:AAA family ATPase [Phycisphaerales bacterium AB-hyl4]|uniref:AAA family ATPase n=1 Tax=Natronomicrosphaera hydrolytica TaxID=3242702 RepID=A0ABV4U0P9_9BACT
MTSIAFMERSIVMQRSSIQRIEALTELPVFPGYTASSQVPVLRKHNLIYGFNGCGKTTLSRVLGCLGTGQRHETWSKTSDFTVKLTDGTTLRPDSLNPEFAERVLVFNTDFVAQNFRWIEGEAAPILYLSKEQKHLSEAIETKQARKVLINRRQQRVMSIFRHVDKEFSEHKTERARLIANELGLGRRYIATNLTFDYKEYKPAVNNLIADDELASVRGVIKQDAPLPKLVPLPHPSISLHALVKDLHAIAHMTLGTISLEALQHHEAMVPWVKHGLEYHSHQQLTSCLFCGSELPPDRLQTLEAAIDDRYDDMTNNIRAFKQRAESLLDELDKLTSTLPSPNDLVESQRVHFTAIRSDLKSQIGAGRGYVKRAIELADTKIQSPHVRLDGAELPSQSLAEQWWEEFSSSVDAFNVIVESHNHEHDRFAENVEQAHAAIKKHYLAEEYSKYFDLKQAAARAEQLGKRLRARSRVLEEEIDELAQQMRQHGPAAVHINVMIYRYLGHKELEIAANENGYEIRRHGKVIVGPPSEGEKNAITLCYFFVMLEGEGRRRNNLVVVLDDPISSLDTRSMNYACGMIRSLNNVAQLIVMTHSVQVMNEVKKWMRRNTENEMARRGKDVNDATAAMFFIDTVQPNGSKSRRSRIVELPKHLRDYESEYHFLFHMILRFLSSEEERANYFFVMPNVLRKVLEVFLAFKLPGPDGLSSKVDQVARDASAIMMDEMRIRALERLAHVESHGDNIEDLVSTSSMTVEETKDAADALLQLIEGMDSEHKRRMCKQCQPT